MNQNDATSVVEELLKTCEDGVKGYKDAAEHAKRPDLKAFFLEQSSERARFVNELQAALTKLGKPGKKESGSVGGAMPAQEAWIDTKVSLGGGDKTILQSIESGEDTAKEAYEKALSASLPPDLADVIRRQARSVRTAHDRVKTMRDGDSRIAPADSSRANQSPGKTIPGFSFSSKSAIYSARRAWRSTIGAHRGER